MNAFKVSGFWLAELLNLSGAQESIARVQVIIDAEAEPEDWKYEYKNVKQLIRKCSQLDWVIIRVNGRENRHWNTWDLVEQRTADIVKFLSRGLLQGRQGPKRGVHVMKWIGYNTYVYSERIGLDLEWQRKNIV
jgi:hypothetical protein